MAIHWQIRFVSLRSETTYTVNVYDDDYTGSAIVLNGGASPFETQEDADDDQFAVTRLQSGYLRIVDNGYAADGTTAFDWKAFAPATDFSRPVTLTHTSGGSTVVDWQGYLQAQNFSGGLYGNPQEREFPVQCILTVLGAKDVDYTQTNVQNFAYLISQVFASITSPISIRYFYFQGSTYARTWLRTRVDWQNFVTDNGDGTLSARYDMLTILEDVCRYWGWTARTCGRDVFFTCADDTSNAPGFMRFTVAELATLGSESDTSVGTIIPDYDTDTLTGEIFASINNEDTMVRGACTAKVSANLNSASTDFFAAFPDFIKMQMVDGGWGSVVQYDDVWATYTNPLTQINTGFFSVVCKSYSTLNMAYYDENPGVNVGDGISHLSAIRFDGSTTSTPLVQMESIYHHAFDGYFTINADVYYDGHKYQEDDNQNNRRLKIKFGIGETRETAQWYNGVLGWQSTEVEIDAYVGYSDGVWLFGSGLIPYIPISADMTMNSAKLGKVFVDISRDSEYAQIAIDIVNFTIGYERAKFLAKYGSLEERKEYKASNHNMVHTNWNADTIFGASDDSSLFGYGAIIYPSSISNNPMESIGYFNGLEIPEQHLANRVANYWSSSKRKITAELLSNMVSVTPDQMITIDGTTCHPISIGHQWRDDITNITFLEMSYTPFLDL